MVLPSFYRTVEKEMKAVEESLARAIDTDVDCLNKASSHLISAGGKRMRPAFVLLSGALFRKDLETLVPIATAVELMHMATLVHDDVVDDSMLRRGIPTVKANFGNRLSVYGGDYIFARSLEIAATYQNPRVVDILAQASMKICVGEIEQMSAAFDIAAGLKTYLRRIMRKTALLIATSCELGALLAGALESEIRAVTAYGRFIGMSFQIVDDILDLTAEPEVLGKPTGSDLAQGVITLPTIYALRCSPQAGRLRELLARQQAGVGSVEDMISLVIAAGGVDYARRVAKRYADRAEDALSHLPRGQARQAMEQVARFVLDRSY